MDHIVEIILHSLHQRNLRGDALGDASCGEVSGDGLGNIVLGGIVNLCCEVSHHFRPVGIIGEQFFVGLYHEGHLSCMANNLVAQLLCMGVHIAGESLTDEQPHHVGREHQRTVLGVGPHNRLEEGVFAREGVKMLVVRKTPGYHGMGIARNAFVAENSINRTGAAI